VNKQACHIEEGCVGEGGSSHCIQHHAAPMSTGFKVGGSGSSDADYELRDGIEMEESRPDNSKEVVIEAQMLMQQNRYGPQICTWSRAGFSCQ
jgi:hypothetical protein